MVEIVENLVICRGVERLIILAGAIVCILCGMLLYKWGTSGVSQLVAESAKFRLRLTNAAPGLLMGLFGVAVLVFALLNSLSVELSESEKGHMKELMTSENELKFSYVGPGKRVTLDRFLDRFAAKDFTGISDQEDLLTSIQTFQSEAEELRDALSREASQLGTPAR
jgi:hypothetical protein